MISPNLLYWYSAATPAVVSRSGVALQVGDDERHEASIGESLGFRRALLPAGTEARDELPRESPLDSAREILGARLDESRQEHARLCPQPGPDADQAPVEECRSDPGLKLTAGQLGERPVDVGGQVVRALIQRAVLREAHQPATEHGLDAIPAALPESCPFCPEVERGGIDSDPVDELHILVPAATCTRREPPSADDAGAEGARGDLRTGSGRDDEEHCREGNSNT
ncbi:MAG: hypothetical protein U5K74_01520 [Gemmatimonadaceae bacterium]|nr:hypothetical protein [Gemmatimonadaceae bacterium]